MKNILLTLFITILFTLNGCKIYKKISYTYDSVHRVSKLKIGMKKDDVFSKIGTPSKKEELNNIEILYFCRSDDVKNYVHVVLENKRIIYINRFSIYPDQIEDGLYDCKNYFQKEHIEVYEKKDSLILNNKGIELYGYFMGMDHGYDFLRGYYAGLEEVNNFNMNDWEREVSFQFGYLQSLKTSLRRFSYLVGRWSAFHEFQKCGNSDFNEQCKKYIEIKPEGILL